MSAFFAMILMIFWYVSRTLGSAFTFYVIEDVIHYVLAYVLGMTTVYNTGLYFMPMRVTTGPFHSLIFSLIVLFLPKIIALIYTNRIRRKIGWTNENDMSIFIIMMGLMFSNFTIVPVGAIYRYGLIEGVAKFGTFFVY